MAELDEARQTIRSLCEDLNQVRKERDEARQERTVAIGLLRTLLRSLGRDA